MTRLASKEELRAFKVGDLVTTEFDRDASALVRRITAIKTTEKTGSGYRISADAGDPCPCCKRFFGVPVSGVDGSWFLPATQEAQSV